MLRGERLPLAAPPPRGAARPTLPFLETPTNRLFAQDPDRFNMQIRNEQRLSDETYLYAERFSLVLGLATKVAGTSRGDSHLSKRVGTVQRGSEDG